MYYIQNYKSLPSHNGSILFTKSLFIGGVMKTTERSSTVEGRKPMVT